MDIMVGRGECGKVMRRQQTGETVEEEAKRLLGLWLTDHRKIGRGGGEGERYVGCKWNN